MCQIAPRQVLVDILPGYTRITIHCRFDNKKSQSQEMVNFLRDAWLKSDMTVPDILTAAKCKSKGHAYEVLCDHGDKAPPTITEIFFKKLAVPIISRLYGKPVVFEEHQVDARGVCQVCSQGLAA